MWDVKAKVIPVVMGALGSVPMVIDVEISVKLIQKCAMLGPAKTFYGRCSRCRGQKIKQTVFLGYPRQLVVTRSQKRTAAELANPFRPHQATLCTLRCQTVCIILFLILHNDKYNNKIN